MSNRPPIWILSTTCCLRPWALIRRTPLSGEVDLPRLKWLRLSNEDSKVLEMSQLAKRTMMPVQTLMLDLALTRQRSTTPRPPKAASSIPTSS